MNSNDILAIGSTIAAALIAIATLLPKLLASFKRDKLDGAFSDAQINQVSGIQQSYEAQLSNLSARLTLMEVKVSAMETTIHMQAVKVTRLIVVVIHLKGLLSTHAVPVPQHIQAEIDLLTTPDRFDINDSFTYNRTE